MNRNNIFYNKNLIYKKEVKLNEKGNGFKCNYFNDGTYSFTCPIQLPKC